MLTCLITDAFHLILLNFFPLQMGLLRSAKSISIDCARTTKNKALKDSVSLKSEKGQAVFLTSSVKVYHCCRPEALVNNQYLKDRENMRSDFSGCFKMADQGECDQ